ncbi:MAG: hypothetical protein EAZ15_05235 [Sphingobacteriales bacterium]|nr:MAG: hypothetical protein EAZ15_05235 [Sphingobacteriales bacterium]
MKKYIFSLLLIFYGLWADACPACEKQQPKILRGFTHGGGPDSQWDYVIVWITVAVVLLTLFYSVKWLYKPGEKGKNHIKNFILNAQ